MKLVAVLLALCALFATSTAWILSTASPEHELARASTDFDGRLSNQRHNALLAARRLDGLIVGPGQTVSFNDAVGSWSRDQGYRKAPVSFSGTLVSTWGGGVCQTSTTLYNAALLAGLEIVERHRHQFAANYVPPGRDAAVAYPNIDLKIRNTLPGAVRIRAGEQNGRLVVSVWGSRGGAPVSLSSVIVQSRVPDRLHLGTGDYSRVRNPGKAGFEVQTFRMVAGRRELVSVDSYPAMSRVVESQSPGK